ncbi:MAG: hypothetical protein ISR58_18250 [Anaerolineales bacterium]|nr:hypothetical protein [Chloroflexota bacterium]MBL6983121.1 hypothetical protein [Anaerolineales bacterium]
MLFLLGLLSLVQICFLPGILILKAFEVKRGIIQQLIFAFALSLIANHLLVIVITSIHVNITYAFYGIITVELLLLAKLYAASFSKSIISTISSKYIALRKYFQELLIFQTNSSRLTLSQTIGEIVGVIFFALAISSIWWAFKVWFTNLDTVFTQWDSVVSWNRWATEWFSGNFPSNTSRYAQLIPTNFAVSYAILGETTIQFFAKSIMPLFNLYILLLMFDLGLESKNPGYFIGVFASRYILKKFLGEYIASGYVDVALAFFTFITVYCLLKAKYISNSNQKLDYMRLGTIFAAGSALTKQNGLFVFSLYPVLAFFIILRDMDTFTRKNQLLEISKWFGIGLLILLPWYAFNEYRIIAGKNVTNISFLIGDRHEGRNLFERFVRAAGLLEEYALLYPLILILLLFIDSAIVWISIVILIPYSIIWALGFSTFPRNLSIALPLLGLVSGLSAQRLIDFCKSLLTKIKIEQLKTYTVMILVILVVIVGGFYVSDSTLLHSQEIRQKEILLSSINHKIYDYFDELGHVEPIMTNYPIKYLPGLENMQIDIGNFSDYAMYRWVLDNHPETRLMLVFENRADEQVLQEIDAELKSGNFELIFKDGKYMFIEIKKY